MKSKKQIKIVMDDGGGTALAVYADKYAHLYNTGSQLADDLILLRDEGITDGWDNNEWGTGITNSDQSCRNYYGTPQQVIDQVISDYNNNDIYGANHQQLARQLLREETS